MKNRNIAAQILSLILALIGVYFSGITLITIYRAIIGNAFIILVVSIPMLVVGILLLLFSYRSIFKPFEKNNKNIASIYAAIILLCSERIIELMIPENDIIVNPRVVASDSTIIIAVLVYYGIRFLLRDQEQNNVETLQPLWGP